MPLMKVIPPGLDFSALKVHLPEDPAVKELQQIAPVFNQGASPRASETPRGEAGTREHKHKYKALGLSLLHHCIIQTCVSTFPQPCSVLQRPHSIHNQQTDVLA